MVFVVWGRVVVRARWLVLGAALVVAVIGVTWGGGALAAMTTGGGAATPGAAATARTRIADRFGDQGVDGVVLYSSAIATVDDPAFRDPVAAALARLRARPEVSTVVSYYDTTAPGLVSRDRHATYAVIRLRATAARAKLDQFRSVRGLATAPGVRTQVGGPQEFEDEASRQVGVDLARAELFSLPLLLVLLVIIFGGLVAAGMPLLVAALAVVGAFTAIRLITMVTDVSVFALNIITLIGLGMAIDYALFIVSRFREELAQGRNVADAVTDTLVTAGRTVTTSGLIVTSALGSLLVFPRLVLRSLAFGGMAAVFLAMVASLTVLPALLAVLGPRINALAVPLPWHNRHTGRCRAGSAPACGVEAGGIPASGPPEGGAPGGGIWATVARSVMRHPVRYLTAILVLLGVLAAPFHRAEFGVIDERVLPASATSHQVADRLSTEFAAASTSPIQVLVSGVPGQRDLARFVGWAAGLPGVVGAQVTAVSGDSAVVSVSHRGDAGSAQARGTVAELRALSPPPGGRISVAGPSADLVDTLDALRTRLPWMLLVIAVALFALLSLAFGSVVLPVKAILTTAASVGASFGVMVWVFQDGHLHSLLRFVPTGSLDADTLVLILAMLLGLSTDYEVFLLSRIREEYDRSGDTTESVALGLQRTGGIITSAALLLIIVVAGFTTGDLLFIKEIGVGTTVAIVVDAALVRPLLVPATLRLLGAANWWAPSVLARRYRRYGTCSDDNSVLEAS